MKEQRLTVKNAKEIETRLKTEKKGNVRVKLIFLNLIANTQMDLEKACEICGIAIPTGYLWIRQWNLHGYDGIKGKEEKGGRPPKL